MGLSHLFDVSRLAEAVTARGTALSCIWVRKHCGWKRREANGVLFPLIWPRDVKMGAELKRELHVSRCSSSLPSQHRSTAGQLCQALHFKDALKLLLDSVTS